MSGYQWINGLVEPSDYYVDYEYEMNPTIGQDIKKQSRKEDLEFLLALGLPVIIILGFIG